MSTVLILTNKEDRTAELVEKEFQKRAVKYARLNTETFGEDFQIDFSINSSDLKPNITIHTSEGDINGNEITSIWYRRPLNPVPPINLQDVEARKFATDELKSLLYGALYSLDCLWVSHPDNIRCAGHKPNQLKVAASIGFKVPQTHISMDPKHIRNFYNAQKAAGKQVIGKLVSKGPPLTDDPEKQYTVHTTLLEDNDLKVEEALAVCPAIYQEYIEKDFELRVTVVGNKAFASEIHSQATKKTKIDWRRYDFPNTPYFPHQLTQDIEQKCIAITEYFGLQFSAIDLIMTPSGETYFLEMNPNGQWGWIEELAGLPITNAIADLLSEQKY